MSDSSERQAVIRRHHHDEVPGPVEAHRSVFEGDDGLRRLRLGVEIGSAALAVGFLVLTLIAPTWVEKLFGVSPDRGNGLWEWASVVLAGAVAALSGALACDEWTRTRRLPPLGDWATEPDVN